MQPNSERACVVGHGHGRYVHATGYGPRLRKTQQHNKHPQQQRRDVSTKPCNAGSAPRGSVVCHADSPPARKTCLTACRHFGSRFPLHTRRAWRRQRAVSIVAGLRIAAVECSQWLAWPGGEGHPTMHGTCHTTARPTKHTHPGTRLATQITTRVTTRQPHLLQPMARSSRKAATETRALQAPQLGRTNDTSQRVSVWHHMQQDSLPKQGPGPKRPLLAATRCHGQGAAR